MGHIYFDTGSVKVNDAVETWFPDVAAQLPWAEFNGERLVDEIAHVIAQHGVENVSTDSIRNTLKQLFALFPDTSANSERADMVHGNLDARMTEDIHSGAPWQGLKACRQRFLILACLARCAHSSPLAIVLANWLTENAFAVSNHEDFHLLSSWGIALHKMQGIIHDSILAQVANSLMHPGPPTWHPPAMPMPMPIPIPYVPHARKMIGAPPHLDHYRGRGRHSGAIAYPDWAVRARSAPACRFRPRSPDWSVGYRLPRPSWVVPAVSRLALPWRGRLGDWDEVRYEQDLQAAAVDNLQRRVRMLELTM